MSATERKVVHEYLKDRDDVETYSEGTEPDRHLVVAPLDSLGVSRETLGTVAPAHAVEPLAAILELQAHRSDGVDDGPRPARGRRRHVADSLSALALPSCARPRGSPTSARAPAGRASRSPPRCRRAREPRRERDPPLPLPRARRRGAGLPNVTVVNARAESGATGIGAHDLVTARALGALPVMLEYAAPLLAEGGHVVAWKGAVAAPRRPRPAPPPRRSSAWSRAEVVASTPFPGARDHTLHVFRKIAPTPARFPRRPGWPRSARSA